MYAINCCKNQSDLIVPPFFVHSIFPYIPKLQMLSLVNLTHLRRIGAAALNRLPALQLLYINNNRQLSDIDADAMRSETTSTDVTVSHWPALRELELIGNNLSTIHASLLSMHGWHQLQRIRMHNNPWSCRCARTWLQAELMPAIGPMLPSTIDLPCDPLSSEPSVRGQLLQEVGAFVESGCSERKFDLKSLLLCEFSMWHSPPKMHWDTSTFLSFSRKPFCKDFVLLVMQ